MTLAEGSEIVILVIEDEPGLNKLLQRSLKREGYQVFGALNAEQGLARIRAEPIPNLLVIDFTLPDSNAFELIQCLEPSFVDIPFIIMSGLYDDELAAEATELGAHAYLLKGFEFMEQLIASIKSLFEPNQEEGLD